MSNLKRWLPPILALGVFVVLLIVFFAASVASKPPQITVLSATRALNVGDVITLSDIQSVSVYDDPRTVAYISSDKEESIVGGVVLRPFAAGEPLTSLGIASLATSDTRLSGLLTDFPNMALFPLPLDANNIVSPEVDNFNSGDIVSIAVVYADRPSLPQNPANFQPEIFSSGETLPTPTPAAPPTPTPSFEDYTQRGKPPVAKMFDNAYRVVAVYGKQEAQAASTDGSGNSVDQTTSYTSMVNQPKPVIMLLVPQGDIEPLSLAVTQGQVFVSMVLDVNPPPGGYSYWDFEKMLEQERERVEASSITATPSAPSQPVVATPTAITPEPTPTPGP